ncbi:lipocalin family protein [Sphingobacterium sp. LRF_L2]|uniref:lipocalin family protein n=1 Tax=Sphingobacterium sp. LRF_L2 TaxID=3369421 RepID=UPI003F5FDE35
MRFYCYSIIVASIVFLSFHRQGNPIQKKWKLVAEELTYFNFDYTKYDGARNRLDSIQNETVEFFPNGSFKSRDGIGTYTVSKDSLHLSLNGKTMPFKYSLKNAKLIIESDSKEPKFIVRSRLYLE